MARKTQKKQNISDLIDTINFSDDNKKAFAIKLLQRIEFMDKTLDELEQTINSEGAIITSTNGNGFDVMSEHPAQKSYNVMVGKYNAMVKSVIDMLPPENTRSDELLDYLGRANK